MVAKDSNPGSSSLSVLGDETPVAEPRAAGADRQADQPPHLWRSLEEYENADGFRELIDSEFPRYAPAEWDDGPSRRSFLKLAGASMGLAGMAACTRQPGERIIPYVEQPENLVPGKAMHFASAMPQAGYLTPVIVESHMGRPTKVAGNPEHPLSRGTTDLFAQASILGLYDPDRSTKVQQRGRILPWETFLSEMQPTLQALAALGGEGLRVVSEPTSSPTFMAQLAAVRRRFPGAKWVQYEPIPRDGALAGSRAAFGTDADTVYDLSNADVVLALDADFLTVGPHHLRYAREFAGKRNIRGSKRTMARLYSVEVTPSGTGALADHRLIARPEQVAQFAAALAKRLGVSGAQGAAAVDFDHANEWLEAVAADLEGHRGRCAVVAGEYAPESVHVLAHALNQALGNVGSTVRYSAPVVAEPALGASALADLAAEMRGGAVDAVVFLGCNPVYDAPGDVDFAAALEGVATSVHLGLALDETGERCTWHVPQSHYLEGWGDGRAADGTLSIIQPLIEPLYASKTDLELLAALAGRVDADSYDLVQETWEANGLGGVWRQALHDGFVADSGFESKPVTLQSSAVAAAVAASASAPSGMVAVMRPDPSLFDGRYANNGWLQELPKPITKVAWDQTAQLAPSTAAELGLATHDVVKVEVAGRSITAPVWLVPGQAPNTVVVHFGYGRTAAGSTANDNGANAQVLRTAGGGLVAAAEVSTTGRERIVASTQEHYQLDIQSDQAEQRHLVKHGTLEHYKEDEHFVEHIGHHIPVAPLFERWKYEGHAWGMVIDLSVCSACNACVVACQAENNIPVVGREQVIAGREMHWLRIDRYFQGDLDAPAVHHQPVACQHCEQAPCEVVCPVGATVHNDEGLNDMVYNRCIGTRYCSNNCPYKVRRFNFFRYQDTSTPVLKLARNPNVSVRARGVMEKCSYCVQRINRVRQQAKVEGQRPIRDGEIKTACQEVCPTHAIAFGDLNDASSEVAAWKKDHLGYQLLDELATLPRTTYLAKMSNPNPALDDGHGGGHHGAAASHDEPLVEVDEMLDEQPTADH